MKFSDGRLVGKVLNTTLTAHWTLILIVPYFVFTGSGVIASVGALAGFLLLMFVHEFGHAVVARRNGLQVLSIELYPLHGLCRFEQPRTHMASISIAWGGVLAQGVLLILAIVLVWQLKLAGAYHGSAVIAFFNILIPLNVLLMVLNLLPIAPLDGATAWKIIPYYFTKLKNRPGNKHRK